jgi:hypothetical protein
MGWTAEETAGAVRAALAGHHRWGAGVDVHDVPVAGRDIQVLLSYARDPQRYAVCFALPDAAESAPDGPWTGTPVESPQEWAAEVAGWLEEEFCTGFARRAGRLPRDGFIELTARPGGCPDGWCLYGVTSESDVRRESGWDMAAARRARAEGRLIAWLRADHESAARTVEPPPALLRRLAHTRFGFAFTAAWPIRLLGHVAVAWEREATGVARVEAVETVEDAGPEAFRLLAGHGVHAAAEAGAHTVVGTHPGLAGLGFRSADGALRLRTRDRMPV